MLHTWIYNSFIRLALYQTYYVFRMFLNMLMAMFRPRFILVSTDNETLGTHHDASIVLYIDYHCCSEVTQHWFYHRIEKTCTCIIRLLFCIPPNLVTYLFQQNKIDLKMHHKSTFIKSNLLSFQKKILKNTTMMLLFDTSF